MTSRRIEPGLPDGAQRKRSAAPRRR